MFLREEMMRVYMPINNNIKLPETPGSINAEMAIIPATKIYNGWLLPSAGDIKEMPKAMLVPTIRDNTLEKFHDVICLPINIADAITRPKKNPHNGSG